MASWLQRQRKGDIMDLAQQAGMRGVTSNMRKDDLIDALEQHLQTNATTLSTIPVFHDYFHRIQSPVKREPEVNTSQTSSLTNATMRAKARASRAFSSEPDREGSPGPFISAVSNAPRVIQENVESVTRTVEDFASALSLPMPPSPTAVADLVERRTSIAADNLRRYYTSHNIAHHVTSLREALSTVYAVISAFVFMEAWSLHRVTLPWKYAFSLPSSKFTSDHPVRLDVPDFFVLLDSSFWAPTLLWFTTSIFIPALLGWFFNFSLVHGKARRGGYNVDPMIFNIAKIWVTWLVYSQGQNFGGMFAATTVQLVQQSMPGGWRGILIGATIGAVISVYEAILKR